MYRVIWKSFQGGFIGCLPHELATLVITNTGTEHLPRYKVRVNTVPMGVEFHTLNEAQVAALKFGLLQLGDCITALESEMQFAATLQGSSVTLY